ncbi:MAG: hypothetical protein V1706_07480 [Pseudomonadota bacterium]
MMRQYCSFFWNKKATLSGKKREMLAALRFWVLIGIVLLPLCSTACSQLPLKMPRSEISADGSRAMDDYALRCYRQGVGYMKEFRYELARQQFAYAASAAASPALYADSVDGLRRAERLIIEGR